ncbi:MAG: DUF2613 domain-containing protein [Mycobacteriaceae bacterium]
MKFLVPGIASVVGGLVIGAATVFGITALAQDNTRPEISQGDPSNSVLNSVEYGSRD